MIENLTYQQQVLKLQAAIKYGLNDINGCRALIDQCSLDDPDTSINNACLLYKDGRYEAALQKFMESSKKLGFKAQIQYYVGLCYYQLKQYVPALKHTAEIIEKGVRDYPELSVGMSSEEMEIRSVANNNALQESYLIEAFNLKAAIEYSLRNLEAAKECLADMPPRLEEELDPVTLHNQALIYVDDDASTCFEKLIFLLQQTTCPAETFGNLLLLYLRFNYYDAAADFLAENETIGRKVLSQYLYDFITATLNEISSTEEAYKMLDELGNKQVEQLRKLTKQVQEARQQRDDELLKKLVTEYDEALERYIPVLMQQAKIYWDMQNYTQVEKIFRKSVEFCNEHDMWKLNVAHVLFMQESKYKEAISFYEPFVKKNYENLLSVTAIILANLCVSYIMTSQNEEAEELMKRIEKEEERVGFEDPGKRVYHLCIVNLVIGTLYCSKGNYEFGIGRVIKSLEPMGKKLGTDTWFYAKRCFCSLFETLAKHMIILKDSVYNEILQFLDAVELHGRGIPAVVDPIGLEKVDPSKNFVSMEARMLKALFLKLYE